MRVVICDDEPYFISMIKEYYNIFSKKYNTLCTVIAFTNGNELLKYLKENVSSDIFILDYIINC